MHAQSGKQCCGRTFLHFLFQNPPRFPQESRNAVSDCSLSVSGSAGQVQVQGVTLSVCVNTVSPVLVLLVLLLLETRGTEPLAGQRGLHVLDLPPPQLPDG